jgi:hypothetical protein
MLLADDTSRGEMGEMAAMAKRIPYHMPGFWYSFLPKPSVGTHKIVVYR